MIRAIKNLFGRMRTRDIVLDNVDRNDGIVFGATAAEFHMGANARQTTDVDAFVPNPQQTAHQTERQLDNRWGGDQFFVKPAKHKGTWKIKDKGFDGQRGTDDDQTVADFSPMPKPRPQTTRMHGVNVVNLNHVQQTKSRSLKQKKFSFRHPKDQEDVNRIKFFNRRI